MHPKLIEIGKFYIPSYGFLVTLGVVLGLWLTLRLAKREGMNDQKREQLTNLIIYSIIGGILGSKLLLVLVDLGYYLKHPVELMYLLRAGGVFYGGLIGGGLTAAFLFRKYGMRFHEVGDLMAPHLALGHAIGRLGCFSAGCCYGKTCDLPIAVTFHDQFAHGVVGVPLGVPLYPTQLISSVSLLVIFLITRYVVYPRRKVKGQVFWAYVLLYSLARFCIEFLRGDLDRGFVVDWLSTSQFIALILVVGSILMLTWLWKKNQKHEA